MSPHANRRAGKDRRVTRSLHYPERRAGFVRRDGDMSRLRRAYEISLRQYRENSTRFLLVLATIVVFNFVDLMMTLRVLRLGGVELNPVMRALFGTSLLVASLVKLGVVGALVLILMMLRRYRRTLEVSLVLLIGFSLLIGYYALLITRLVA